MCGITGILNLNESPVDPQVISAMTEAIRHRGPDGEGVWIDGCVGLGHTRLAIMDLSDDATQPMVSSDGRYVLVFNGEIYNYQKLRTLLMELGYVFKSTGDTEVLLYALIEWGEDAVSQLNGMFAFGLWDATKKELMLGRDRYGIKPLYTSCHNGYFVFGSEIKAITAHPDFQANLNMEGLIEYFTFQNFFSANTLFSKIQTFPSGNCMRFSIKEEIPRFSQYWNFNFVDSNEQIGEEEYIEELDRLIRQAVNRQLMGDVEIGSYLSGGMDSSSITCLASQTFPGLKTFTCGFELYSASGLEQYCDERESAERMAYLCGTEHYQVVLKAGDMERALPEIVYHMDEPRVGQSYPNFYAAKLASRFVKGVLAGTGGDELLAGYPWRYYRSDAYSSFEEFIDSFYNYWQRLIPNRCVQKVFAPVWNDVSHVCTRDIFRDVFNGCDNDLTKPEDYINHSLFFEAKTFLHGLLVVEDKLSMAHGLETRVPMLDNDLVNFAMKIPVRFKLGNLGRVDRINENESGNKVDRYYRNTGDGKLIMRKAMGRYMPHDITRNRKQCFSGPDGSWFKGDSIELVRRCIYNDRALIYNFLDKKTIRQLVDEHLSGRVNRRLLIWSLLHFEEWIKTFLR